MSQNLCRACARPVVEIRLNTDSGEVTMQSCAACDDRRWLVDNQPTDLPGALAELASAHRRQ